MKEKLTLTIEKEIKRRAKRHAKAVGRSISEMVEDFLNETATDQYEEFSPPPGSGVEQFITAIPESKKVARYDYKKRKQAMMEDRYGHS